MGFTEQLGQIVYILPDGWICSDEAYAMRAWRQHERFSDPRTITPRFSENPPWKHSPTTRFNQGIRHAKPTGTWPPSAALAGILV